MKTCLTALFLLLAVGCKPADAGKSFQETKIEAEKGNARAQSNLGLKYANGLGVPKDEDGFGKSISHEGDLYRADQGDVKAQFYLGFLYANGYGVVKDEAEAVKWFRKAADQGDAQAQSKLGSMYGDGLGVPKNEAEALKWYRKAADQGYAQAQSNLGSMYDYGLGVPKNEAEAYKWYLLAGAQGDILARLKIPFIEGNITPAQRAEGQRLAREWKPRKLNPTYEFHP